MSRTGRLRIGELAERLGVNARTIRFYESIGLLPAPQRLPSGYRTYGEQDAERLAFVRSAQQFGLHLDEIREVLGFRDRGEPPCDYVLGVVRREVADLDRRIAELQAAREQLLGLLARTATLPANPKGYCGLLEHHADHRR